MVLTLLYLFNDSEENHKQSTNIYTEFTKDSIESSAEALDIFITVVSQANHDPDFDLAKGSRQMVLTLLYLFNDSEENHKQSTNIYTEFTKDSIESSAEALDIFITVVSQANHDPDFDLAKGSRQMVLTLLYLFNDSEENHKQSTNIYTEFTKDSIESSAEAIDIFITVVSQANHDPDFDLAKGSRQMVLTLLYLFNDSEENHKQSTNIYTEFTKDSIESSAEAIDIFITVVSQANHDPDFDLAKGSRQMVLTLLYLFNDSEENHKQTTNINTEF